jgi:hypothetical protein
LDFIERKSEQNNFGGEGKPVEIDESELKK